MASDAQSIYGLYLSYGLLGGLGTGIVRTYLDTSNA